MILPDSLLVMGTRWRVEGRHPRDDAEAAVTIPRSLTIEVDPAAEEPLTMLHELWHAIEYAFDTPGQSEKHANMFARGLTSALRENPGLLGWLELALNPPKTENEDHGGSA